MLRFLVFGKKFAGIHPYIHQREFRRIFFPNARKRSTGRNAGKRSTGAVLRAKLETMKKYFVSTAWHSKLQKKHLRKSLAFSVLFCDDAFFPETSHRRWTSILFLGEESVPWPRKSVLVRRSVLSAHKTEFLTQK